MSRSRRVLAGLAIPVAVPLTVLGVAFAARVTIERFTLGTMRLNGADVCTDPPRAAGG